MKSKTILFAKLNKVPGLGRIFFTFYTSFSGQKADELSKRAEKVRKTAKDGIDLAKKYQV